MGGVNFNAKSIEILLVDDLIEIYEEAEERGILSTSGSSGKKPKKNKK